MEKFDFKLSRAFQPNFDAVPSTFRRTVFGIEYILLKGMQGGQLLLTRHGWPWAKTLMPENWYIDGRFKETGQRLLGSTGTVYLEDLPHVFGTHLKVVLKINRFAQEAPVFYDMNAAGNQPGMGRGMRFLSAFEEFSLLQRLRGSHLRRHLNAIRTQHPLAIYVPPTRYPDWKLGRRETQYWAYDRALRMDQENYPEQQRVSYEWDRVYITVFHWIEGVDAQAAADRKLISDEEMVALTRRVNDDLLLHGFAVADNKPLHIILRLDRKGRLLRHEGQLYYALIDYELLYRPDHKRPTAPALD